jgi:hypothetical protein
MAAFEPPNWQTPSRRQMKAEKPEEPDAELDSRSARNRLRREKSMERRFTWLFVTAVALVTLYLVSRTPAGVIIMHHLLAPNAR